MIRGKLHHKRRGIAGEHLCFLQNDTGADDGRHADEICGGSNPRRASENRAGDHGNKGQLRTAGDKGRRHDRHTSVTFVFNGTGRHDSGDTAAGTDQDRDKGFSRKPESPENTVHHKGDTRHITARFKESEEDKQDKDLRNKAKHRADTGDDTVQNESFEPIRTVNRVKPAFDKDRDSGHPYAVIGRIRLLKAILLKIGDRFEICRLNDLFIVLFRIGNRGIINRHIGLREGFLILDGDHSRRVVGGGLESFQCFQCGCRIKIIGLRIQIDESVHCIHGIRIRVRRIRRSGISDAEQVPAVAEHAVIRPVGRKAADRRDRDKINDKHDDRKDRKCRPPVGHDTVDLIGNGKLFGFLFLIAALHDGSDIYVSLIGDDAFRIIVKLLFRRLDILLDVIKGLFRQIQGRQHLFVALKNLDCIPALLLCRHIMYSRFLDMRDRMLDHAGKAVLRNGFCSFRRCHRFLRGFHDPGSLQRRDLEPLPRLTVCRSDRRC